MRETMERLIWDCGRFEVDDQGRVWRIKSPNYGNKSRRRADRHGRKGYKRVMAMVNGRQHSTQAQRLVWHVLKGPIPPGLEVNHIDGNKTNNHPDNLELNTPSENLRHAYRIGLRKGRRSKRDIEIEKRPRVCHTTMLRLERRYVGVRSKPTDGQPRTNCN